MNEQIAYPLAIDGLSTVKSDGDPNFFKAFIGQQWAQPSYTHQAEEAAKGKAARLHIEKQYTPKIIANIVAAEVQRLQGVLREKQRQQQSRTRGAAAANVLQGIRSGISKKGMFGVLGGQSAAAAVGGGASGREHLGKNDPVKPAPAGH